MAMNFESLYDKFYPQVYNYIFYRVTKKEITEDIVGDIFTKILSKHESYDQTKSKISTWIFTISRNTLIDYYRNQKNVSIDYNETNLLNVEDTDSKNFTSNHEKKDEILCILRKLNNIERTVIALKYFSDFSYKQISDHTGYSSKHIGVILNRTLKKLRKICED